MFSRPSFDVTLCLGQDFVDTFFLELEGELRVEETVKKVRALTLKNTLLSGDVEVTIGGKVKTYKKRYNDIQ